MANNCFFDIEAYGRPEQLKRFADMLAWKGEYEEMGLGRVFTFEAEFIEADKDGYAMMRGWGDCAWSVYSAMIDSRSRKLVEETANLGIAVEIYSSETGCAFQEHYIIANGNVIVDECVDYEEYQVEDQEPEILEEYAEYLGKSVEYLKEHANENGDYTVGGFEEWTFSDLSVYIEAEPIEVLEDKFLQEAGIAEFSQNGMECADDKRDGRDGVEGMEKGEMEL